ncbi:hypothetical protein [Candidatus Nitrosocosmicus sp. T]
MSLCIGILGCSNFGFRDAFASLNNADNTTIDTPKSQDKIFGNTSANGNPMGFPNIKNDIYYQVNIDNVLNPVSISTVGVRISNILYDNDQKSITLVITPGQSKSDSVVIDLPRRIIDSRIDETDKNFTVLINNQPSKYQEIVNKNKSNISSEDSTVENETRKLVIEFGKDAKVIKIIGTELSNITSQDQSGLNNILQQIIPITVNNKIYYTSIELKGGSLSDLQLQSKSGINKTLTLDITSYNENGELSIDLPRRIIDSRIDETDKNFTVLINNQPSKYQEIVNKNKSNISSEDSTVENETRKLVIEFGKDAKVIKIIGTELSNITSQDQSGLSISKPNDIHDGNQNLYFLISVVSFILGIIFTIVYFLYRKRKFHIRK